MSDLTRSQKLCERHALSKEDLRTMKKAVSSAQNLRETAIKESMTWSDVKTKFCAGYCLFCVVDLRLRLARKLTREGLECMLCPWLLLEEENCVSYLDHKDAIARYKRWLKELDQLIDWTEAKNATRIHTGV